MDYNQSLNSSVGSLGNALSSLRGINQNMEQGSKDFERMTTVLKLNQVFGIVTESEISEAKGQLASETQPQIEKLMARIESELARMDRKEKTLSSKAELQQGRLQEVTSNHRYAASSSSSQYNVQQMEKLRQLQEKRDRLAYSLSRLNLKGRKVRMSMAFADHHSHR